MTNLLITGGTGTFGGALTERLLNDGNVNRIKIISRDEKKQQAMRTRFDDARLRFHLRDVRNLYGLTLAFRGVDVVVHAAALKQVDRALHDIDEFLDTDVFGTRNVLRAAHSAGVKQVVILSSDKACAATTTYGCFKYASEQLAIAYNEYGATRSCAVRYGNVLGSRGSVLETWANQYAASGSIKITDERMTRFWMSPGQAVDLVLLAIDRMGGGEVFIPKDLDRSSVVALAMEHYPDAYVVVTGKRSNEKMHEWLVHPEEIDRLHDCGDVYALVPFIHRWQPAPYGLEFPLVVEEFEYRSDL